MTSLASKGNSGDSVFVRVDVGRLAQTVQRHIKTLSGKEAQISLAALESCETKKRRSMGDGEGYR